MSISSTQSVQGLLPKSPNHVKSNISLHNLFSNHHIVPRTPFFYYRESDAGAIYYACRIKNVDEKGHIFISPSIPGTTSFESLRDFETWIVAQFNKNHNLKESKKAVLSSNSSQYFFVGTSISNLKNSYA
ncbi:hypothetical protein C1646_754297 [Rhizophagus diaphanus]|nr:hypothetical protein C1646_754297 [Rhizophagus diaphanus] [Rhizophagus sp. MUCL 43196]